MGESGFEGVISGTGVGAEDTAGAGGSAIPCGLVFPTASAKLMSAIWLPDVREAAAVYWNTLSAPLSTIQMLETLLGSIVIPVGW